MASSNCRPTIIQPKEIAVFIEDILRHSASEIHLIICSTREDFLQQLLASTAREKERKAREAEATGFEPHAVKHILSRPHELLVATLRQLSQSSRIKTVFCASLPHLQAYLSVYAIKGPSKTEQGVPRPVLAVLNPIAIHRDTASFSAQGINRTLASVVEASLRANESLMIMECSLAIWRDMESDCDGPGTPDETENQPRESAATSVDPWEEQISILNVTTKSFGAGERGWVGRTVKIRSIAERWFNFK